LPLFYKIIYYYEYEDTESDEEDEIDEVLQIRNLLFVAPEEQV